jgi:carboxymethylenebutenolidase
MGTTEQINVREGVFDAYIAVPDLPVAPGLVLIQYISGVNRVMRALADAFARSGFLVACPDLYWRQEPNVRLNDDPSKPDPAEQNRALELNARFVDDTGVTDLDATLEFLRGHPRCTGRVGALGYCLGGRLAFLMAARTNVDCAVGYYGVNLQHYLNEVISIRRPLLLHVAERDELCPPEIRDRIVAKLRTMPHVSVEIHPNTRHAFALRGGANFDAGAAERADRQSLVFLQRNLAG